MAAQRIAEDEYTVTYQTDDGQIVRTGKDQASMLGDDFGMTQPPSSMGNNAPEPQPSIATSAPDIASLQRDPTAPDPAAAAPPVPPPAQQVQGSPSPQPPVAIEPPSVDEAAPAPTSPNASPVPPQPMPQNLGDVGRSFHEAQSLQEAAAIEKAAADGAYHGAVAKTLGERNEELEGIKAQQDAQRTKDLAEQEALYSRMTASMQAANDHKVDSGRYWDSRSTGQKVLAGIGVALAGLGMAMKGQGGKNPALDMIFKAIDDDVKMQMHQGDKLGKNVAQVRGLMETHGKLAESRQGQYNAMSAGALEKTARDIEAIGAKSASEQVKANAMAAAAAIREKGAGHFQELIKDERQWTLAQRSQAEQERHARAAEQNARANTAVSRAGLRQRQKEFDLEFGYKQEKDAADREAMLQAQQGKISAQQAETQLAQNKMKVFKLDGNQDFIAPSEKSAEELRKKLEFTKTYAGLADRLVELRKTHGQELDTANSEAFQEMKSLQANMVALAKDGFELGVLSADDKKIIDDAQGADPTAWKSTITKLQTQRDVFVTRFNNTLSANGYEKRWEPPKVEAAPVEEMDGVKKVLTRDVIEPDGTIEKLGAVLGVGATRVALSQVEEIEATKKAGMAALRGDPDARALIEKQAGRKGSVGDIAVKFLQRVEKLEKAGGFDNLMRQELMPATDVSKQIDEMRRRMEERAKERGGG